VRLIMSVAAALLAAMAIVVGSTGLVYRESLQFADLVGSATILLGGGALQVAICDVPVLRAMWHRGTLVRWSAAASGALTASLLTLPAYTVLFIGARQPGRFASGEAVLHGAAFAAFGFTFGALSRHWCLTKP